MTNRAEFERLLDVYGFRCERFGQDLSTHARAQVVSAFAALASAPIAGEAITDPMIQAGAKAAREYFEQTGGNSPAVIYKAMRAAAPQASEAVRGAGIAASEDVAPWPDYAGNPIKHGDRIRHPEGLEGVVVRLPGYADANDAWCVAYQDRTVSRLSLQIGDRGQAVVQGALSAQPGAQRENRDV